jgi:hypothetical protein
VPTKVPCSNPIESFNRIIKDVCMDGRIRRPIGALFNDAFHEILAQVALKRGGFLDAIGENERPVPRSLELDDYPADSVLAAAKMLELHESGKPQYLEVTDATYFYVNALEREGGRPLVRGDEVDESRVRYFKDGLEGKLDIDWKDRTGRPKPSMDVLDQAEYYHFTLHIVQRQADDAGSSVRRLKCNCKVRRGRGLDCQTIVTFL